VEHEVKLHWTELKEKKGRKVICRAKAIVSIWTSEGIDCDGLDLWNVKVMMIGSNDRTDQIETTSEEDMVGWCYIC